MALGSWARTIGATLKDLSRNTADKQRIADLLKRVSDLVEEGKQSEFRLGQLGAENARLRQNAAVAPVPAGNITYSGGPQGSTIVDMEIQCDLGDEGPQAAAERWPHKIGTSGSFYQKDPATRQAERAGSAHQRMLDVTSNPKALTNTEIDTMVQTGAKNDEIIAAREGGA